MRLNVGWLNEDGTIRVRRDYGENLPLDEQISLCSKWIASLEEEKAELWEMYEND